MPKEYPRRDTNDDDANTQVDICECGHAKIMHNSSKDHNLMKGECYQCLCPEYKFEQKLTIKQSNDLDMHLSLNRNKDKSWKSYERRDNN